MSLDIGEMTSSLPSVAEKHMLFIWSLDCQRAFVVMLNYFRYNIGKIVKFGIRHKSL